jgi:hypothetical protein
MRPVPALCQLRTFHRMTSLHGRISTIIIIIIKIQNESSCTLAQEKTKTGMTHWTTDVHGAKSKFSLEYSNHPGSFFGL